MKSISMATKKNLTVLEMQESGVTENIKALHEKEERSGMCLIVNT